MARQRTTKPPAAATSKTPPRSTSSAKKRQLASSQLDTSHATPTPTRHSKRFKTAPESEQAVTPTTLSEARSTGSKKSTPKKSQYFEDDETDPPLTPSSEGLDGQESASGYEDDEAEVPTSDTSGAEEEDESGYSEEERKKSRITNAATRTKIAPRSKKSDSTQEKVNGAGAELWRPGVSAGLGPGKKVIVRLPKAREAGSTPYKNETIHPNTLLFLKDLARNNEREWLKMHDPDFRASEKDFDSFVAVLSEKIIEKDETIPELPVKDIKFRIYRDIRFSPDPTPYKPWFSAAWKGPYAAYYLQVAHGRSFMGAGLWHPDAIPLHHLRRDIDRKPHKIKDVLTDARLRKEFLNGIPNDEKKAVKAFIDHNQENALKTKPKGYDADHPNIGLLRLRNYTIGRKLRDDEVLGPKALECIADLMGVLTPYISYLNGVVMPDHPPSSSSEDESEDEEEAGSSEDEDDAE